MWVAVYSAFVILAHDCAGTKQRVQNYENANIRIIEQGEARKIKYKRLNLGGGLAYDRWK